MRNVTKLWQPTTFLRIEKSLFQFVCKSDRVWFNVEFLWKRRLIFLLSIKCQTLTIHRVTLSSASASALASISCEASFLKLTSWFLHVCSLRIWLIYIQAYFAHEKILYACGNTSNLLPNFTYWNVLYALAPNKIIVQKNQTFGKKFIGWRETFNWIFFELFFFYFHFGSSGRLISNAIKCTNHLNCPFESIGVLRFIKCINEKSSQTSSRWAL